MYINIVTIILINEDRAYWTIFIYHLDDSLIFRATIRDLLTLLHKVINDNIIFQMIIMCCIDSIFHPNGLGLNPVTISDFIQMVWDQRPPVIVMLTHLVEKGKVKSQWICSVL